jgi:hypothetical protein
MFLGGVHEEIGHVAKGLGHRQVWRFPYISTYSFVKVDTQNHKKKVLLRFDSIFLFFTIPSGPLMGVRTPCTPPLDAPQINEI